MAAEIQVPFVVSGYTAYAILRNASGQVWNGSAFAAFSEANRNAGAITLTEQTGTSFYVGDIPALLTTRGRYKVVAHRRVGVSPALSDPPIFEDWLDFMQLRASVRFGGSKATHDYATGVSTFYDGDAVITFTETTNSPGTTATRAVP